MTARIAKGKHTMLTLPLFTRLIQDNRSIQAMNVYPRHIARVGGGMIDAFDTFPNTCKKKGRRVTIHATHYAQLNGKGPFSRLIDPTVDLAAAERARRERTFLHMWHGGTGISMTTAGGTTAGQTGLSRIERFVLDDGSVFDGGTPVAVQEIGALPPSVDGIIGLSFLQQFRTVTFDFSRDELVLSNDNADEGKREESWMEEEPADYLETLTDATLRICRLGIYSVSVTLDGRGPVSMLLDTGASASYLNWAGITEDMNLSNDHPLVRRNAESLGAMGADDTALELTHRFVCQRRLKLEGGGDPFFTGLDLTESDGIVGGERGSVNVDIGDLPVLEGLKGERVNGILGADLLTRCDVLRIDFGVSPPKMALERKVGNTSVPFVDLRRKP